MLVTITLINNEKLSFETDAVTKRDIAEKILSANWFVFDDNIIVQTKHVIKVECKENNNG